MAKVNENTFPGQHSSFHVGLSSIQGIAPLLLDARKIGLSAVESNYGLRALTALAGHPVYSGLKVLSCYSEGCT